jgi:hypothetical protein
MCSYAEEAYKTKHSVTSVREALPSWATLKSYVLRGMTLGLSPLEYDTETKFRAAAAAKIGREPGAVVTAIATAIQRSGPVPFDEVEGFVATTTIAEPLRVMVSNLVFSAEIVKPGKIAQAEEVLRKAWHDLSPYIDKRKLT